MKKVMIGALIVLKTASACDKPIVEKPNKVVCKKEYSVENGKKVIKEVCKTKKEWADSIRGCYIKEW